MSGLPRLLWRNWTHTRGASLLVSLLVVVVSAMLVAAPVVFSRMVAREFDQSIEEATPTDRHLIASSTAAPDSGPVRDPEASDLEPRVLAEYGALDEQLAGIRETFPQPLRDAVGAARWSVTTGILPLGEARPDSRPRMAVPLIELRVDPRATEHATLVEGAWPLDETDVEPETPVGVVLSEEAADRLAWQVGEVRAGFVLTGIFRPRDAGDDYWSLNDSMLQPFIFDDGDTQTRITATAFTDPLRYVDAFPDAPPPVVSLKLWYPLELGKTSGGDVDDVLAQLRGVTAKAFTRVAGGLGGTTSVELTATGIPVLEGAQGRTDAARSVLTLAATGPLGSAVVVLVLTVRAFSNRRRHAIGLLAGRGASRLELRLLLFADGLMAGVLPAAAFIALARWELGDELPVAAAVLAGVVGLVPAAILTTARIDAAIRPTRVDTGVRSRSRNRWVAEVLLLALAVASVYLLVANGLAPDERGGDVDVLVAAAPVLLAGAACVTVLRLYPLPMQALSRWLRRGRSTIGFLGSVRALRDPVVGVAPVLAVLAGVSIAVFSAVVLSTLDRGAHDAALVHVGADLRFDGALVTDDQLGGILDVPGVAAAARVQHAAPRSIAIPGKSAEQTSVYLADLDRLGAAQARVPGGYDARGDGVVVSSALMTEEATITYSGGPVPVIDSTGLLPGVTGDEERWVLVDGAHPGFGPFLPDAVLIALTEDADSEAVRDAVGAIVGTTGVFMNRTAIEADLRGDSISSGVRSALFAALGAAGLAAAATVVLTLVSGATARTRLLAILRVLGVAHRQRRWLAVWEQAPVATVALVVGGVLGLGLALMVHAAVDLSPFAGGGFQPRLTFQWLQIGALVGGFVVLMTVAIGLGLVATRRTSAAVAVRLDEE